MKKWSYLLRPQKNGRNDRKGAQQNCSLERCWRATAAVIAADHRGRANALSSPYTYSFTATQAEQSRSADRHARGSIERGTQAAALRDFIREMG